MSGLAALSALDLHRRTVSDFAVRTKSGAALSLAALALAAALLVSEARVFLSREIEEKFEVDASARGGDGSGAGGALRVNFDVVFPSLPCVRGARARAVVRRPARAVARRHLDEIFRGAPLQCPLHPPPAPRPLPSAGDRVHRRRRRVGPPPARNIARRV